MRTLSICYLTLAAVLFAAGVANADVVPVFVSDKLGAASQFALLALNNGNMTINSATSITGNVGYSNGVTSTTNQKVSTFNGTAYLDSEQRSPILRPLSLRPAASSWEEWRTRSWIKLTQTRLQRQPTSARSLPAWAQPRRWGRLRQT